VENIAIKVEHVSKVFRLPHEKTSSVKSTFVNFYRKKKGYELQKALDDISFEIKKGEFFGIVGRNGSGKSTLLKLLAGIYTPTKGQVHVRGTLTPFIELGVGFNPELTGRENVYLNGALLGFNRKEMQAMYKDIVDFAELEKFMDQKLKNYSSGMQVRLAFSIAIRAKSDILLVDEVLAVGDAAFQRKCFDYFKQLKKSDRTVVFISHDMNAVRQFCERGILIDAGKMLFEGSSYELANQYSKLFLEEDEESPETEPKHSGIGDAKYSVASAKIFKDEVSIKAEIKIKKDIEDLQYGIHILDSDGTEITAMNNRTLKLPDIHDIKGGSSIELKWTVLNIFNDGRYVVTLSLADGSGGMLDRYEEAASFRIKRPERSTTAVLPPIKVEYSILQNNY
jgi:ABC-2 type transport system ATP-binding protein